MLGLDDIQNDRERAYARFQTRYSVSENGCWTWSGSTDSFGYGRLYVNGRGFAAHRFSWLFHKGEIPAGYVICHHCDNPSCVNPDHLFCGTTADNNFDRSVKLRSHRPTGARHNQRKLTPEQVEAIRADSRSCSKLGREYGVGADAISRIRRNLTWRHVGANAEVKISEHIKSRSTPRGGFIVCHRSETTSGLISSLRPTEYTDLNEAEAEAMRLSALKSCEYAVFQQVLSISADAVDQGEAA